jgi:hypothetical protein
MADRQQNTTGFLKHFTGVPLMQFTIPNVPPAVDFVQIQTAETINSG